MQGRGNGEGEPRLYLTPVFGVLFAALFLGEQVTPALLVGGAVILIGVIISNKGK